jgi:hypothetical protein
MIFPAGKFLYRGSHAEANQAQGYLNKRPNYLRSNLPVYFSNTKNSVRSYGTAVKYVTTRPLNLLNMGNVNTVTKLHAAARSNSVKGSILKAFRTANGEVRRFSTIKYDIHVAKFICTLGYDGYYAPRLRTKYQEGSFHPEIVLCHAKDVLKVYNVKPMLNAPPTTVRRGVNNNLRNVVGRTNYGRA